MKEKEERPEVFEREGFKYFLEALPDIKVEEPVKVEEAPEPVKVPEKKVIRKRRYIRGK